MHRRTSQTKLLEGVAITRERGECIVNKELEPADLKAEGLLARLRQEVSEIASDLGSDRWDLAMGSDWGTVRFYRREGRCDALIAEARF